MKLVQECTFSATLKPPLPIGAGPIGMRMYYEITGGDVTGERLRGKLLGGGEWALIGPDGFLRVDVRAQVEARRHPGGGDQPGDHVRSLAGREAAIVVGHAQDHVVQIQLACRLAPDVLIPFQNQNYTPRPRIASRIGHGQGADHRTVRH